MYGLIEIEILVIGSQLITIVSLCPETFKFTVLTPCHLFCDSTIIHASTGDK